MKSSRLASSSSTGSPMAEIAVPMPPPAMKDDDEPESLATTVKASFEFQDSHLHDKISGLDEQTVSVVLRAPKNIEEATGKPHRSSSRKYCHVILVIAMLAVVITGLIYLLRSFDPHVHGNHPAAGTTTANSNTTNNPASSNNSTIDANGSHDTDDFFPADMPYNVGGDDNDCRKKSNAPQVRGGGSGNDGGGGQGNGNGGRGCRHGGNA